jgi:hypothetical protein
MNLIMNEFLMILQQQQQQKMQRKQYLNNFNFFQINSFYSDTIHPKHPNSMDRPSRSLEALSTWNFPLKDRKPKTSTCMEISFTYEGDSK